MHFAQAIYYAYNERGWLYASTAPLFQMLLYYNGATAIKMYNGNITYQYWGAGSYTNHYTYAYDKLDRLTSGVLSDYHWENGITYDPIGNILTLNRYSTNSITRECVAPFQSGASIGAGK